MVDLVFGFISGACFAVAVVSIFDAARTTKETKRIKRETEEIYSRLDKLNDAKESGGEKGQV